MLVIVHSQDTSRNAGNMSPFAALSSPPLDSGKTRVPHTVHSSTNGMRTPHGIFIHEEAAWFLPPAIDTPTRRHGTMQVKDKDEKTLTYTQFVAALNVVAVTLFPEVRIRKFHLGEKNFCMAANLQPPRAGDKSRERGKTQVGALRICVEAGAGVTVNERR